MNQSGSFGSIRELSYRRCRWQNGRPHPTLFLGDELVHVAVHGVVVQTQASLFRLLLLLGLVPIRETFPFRETSVATRRRHRQEKESSGAMATKALLLVLLGMASQMMARTLLLLVVGVRHVA